MLVGFYKCRKGLAKAKGPRAHRIHNAALVVGALQKLVQSVSKRFLQTRKLKLGQVTELFQSRMVSN